MLSEWDPRRKPELEEKFHHLPVMVRLRRWQARNPENLDHTFHGLGVVAIDRQGFTIALRRSWDDL
jgi:hypothetical protein